MITGTDGSVAMPTVPNSSHKSLGHLQSMTRPPSPARWTGQPVTPQLLARLSPTEVRVLAYLTWVSAAHRQVSRADVALILSPTGTPIGLREAGRIIEDLTDAGLVRFVRRAADSIGTDEMAVFVGGHVPAHPRTTAPATSRFSPPATPVRPATPKRPRVVAPRPAPDGPLTWCRCGCGQRVSPTSGRFASASCKKRVKKRRYDANLAARQTGTGATR